VSGPIAALALLCAAVNLLAGGLGAWLWWQVRTSPAFWPLLRGAQAVAVALAITGAVLGATGADPDDSLFFLYALLPAAVSFVAEQLRLAAAENELDTRGLAGARAVEALPERDQRSVVLAIVRREMGVMTAAALVTVVLALRAAGWL